MVSASKMPIREIEDIVNQINGNNGKKYEQESQLRTRRIKDTIEITPTCVFTLLHQGKVMAAIHTSSKMAVFYHPQHYIYRRDFEDRLKPLVDYLFGEGYTLMSQQEYEERFRPAPKDTPRTANN